MTFFTAILFDRQSQPFSVDGLHDTVDEFMEHLRNFYPSCDVSFVGHKSTGKPGIPWSTDNTYTF